MASSRNNYHHLELSVKNGLHFTSNDVSWRGILPFKTEQALEIINPFAFYCFNNEPLILFFHNPTNQSHIHQLCWNFNKSPVIIFLKGNGIPISADGCELKINVDDKIEIYNGFDLDENKKRLNRLPGANINQFTYWNIVSGKTWEMHAASFKNENKVDYRLLENIGAVRKILIEGSKDKKETSVITNRVLGRLIFVRYLIDRKVKINFKKNAYLSNTELTKIIENIDELYELFAHLQNVFNGDLFPFVRSPKAKDSENQIEALEYEKGQLNQMDIRLIARLFRGDEISTGQLSLFDLYDFSIIPIELVSNIYEYFMGYEKQGKNKAYYTPSFLVDYLIGETIEPYLNIQDTWHCTTLDPACGSGIFLVETLRRIILKFKVLNPDIAKNNVKEFKYHINNILKDNIFGIDKDRDAIDVAIFSLYITLLDFIERPRDIEDFRFPYLLGSNFFEADFFQTDFSKNKKNDFVEKLKRVKLNFIIGNPPWGRVDSSPYLEYAKKRLKEEPGELIRLQKLFPEDIKGQKKKIKLIENNEIAQGFLLRTSDFASKEGEFTKCALLVTSKVLHNLQSNVFRNYFLNHTKVEKVIDFSAIRNNLFIKPKGANKTVGPCAFLIFRWDELSDKSNFVHHLSPKHNNLYKIFKILSVQKFDYKIVVQQSLIDYDWAWKSFLYGNILDMHCINRIKSISKYTINDLLREEKRFVFGQGLMLGGGDENSTDYLENMTLIDTDIDVDSYHVSINPEREWYTGKGKFKKIWNRKFAHRSKEELFENGLFDGKCLVVKGGLPDFRGVSAYVDEPGVFKSSITGIKAKQKKDISLIKNLVGIINSNLFVYYLVATGSSFCVEREEAHDEEKFTMPVIENQRIGKIVDKIISLKKNILESNEKTKNQIVQINDKLKIIKLQEKIKNLQQEIEEIIYETYNLSKKEIALINFSQEISIPLFKGDSNPFNPIEPEQLKRYAQIFINYFTRVFNRPGKYFKVEIYENKFMVGVKFRIVKEEPQKLLDYKQDDEGMQILELLSVISFEQITEKVFVQKDVKLVEHDSFTVIKPNEFKCWHEAVAYLDLHEFKLKFTKPQISTVLV